MDFVIKTVPESRGLVVNKEWRPIRLSKISEPTKLMQVFLMLGAAHSTPMQRSETRRHVHRVKWGSSIARTACGLKFLTSCGREPAESRKLSTAKACLKDMAR